jgi:hypothetical protein
MNQQLPIVGTWETIRKAASTTTPFRICIPPWPGRAGSPIGKVSPYFTHVTKVIFSTPTATAETIGIMRPFNYTTFAADAAAGATTLSLTADPGLYSTAANWKYGTVLNGTPSVADNAIATSDVLVYQLADGSWEVNVVTGGSGTAPTVSAIGGSQIGAKAGGLVYFFGVIADSDPNTGAVSPQTTIAASATRDASWSDTICGVVHALHAGDPLVFYDPAVSSGSILEACCGYYSTF